MSGMPQPPLAVLRAARALGLDASRLYPLGGASAATWGAGDQVLRVGRRGRMTAELAAAAAAATVLPVPAVLDQAEVHYDLAVLLERRHPPAALAHIRAAYERLRHRTAST